MYVQYVCVSCDNISRCKCVSVCVCALPDSLMRRSDAILVLTSGLNREVAAGKGLEPAACASSVFSACVSAACSACAPGTLSERASSLVCVLVCVFAGCVCRLAASEGGCNTLDPRFIFRCVLVCFVKKKKKREGVKTQ